MPVTDAAVGANEIEFAAYELAYHVLPTVAEGEVGSVTDALKQLIADHQGEVFDEEGAERFELAYEIEKYLEGRNRRFGSAYFGWIRFRMNPEMMPTFDSEIEHQKSILRHLIVRLTKVEEVTPFRFHESLERKQVETVGDEEVAVEAEAPEAVSETTDVAEGTETTPAATDEKAGV